MGLETVPCIIADDLTPEQIKAFRLADNKVGELAEWDVEKLTQELMGLEAFDMDVFGFDTLPDPTKDCDGTDVDVTEMLESIVEPNCQTGSVWRLGRHRLMCGDSTKAADVARLLDGEKADLLLTDPPYNVAIENSAGLTIQNDDMDDLQFYEFLKSAFAAADSNLKEGGAFYIWHADSEGLSFRRACDYVGWDVRQCLVWVKNSIVMGRQDYQWKHEPCLYGWKDGAAHFFIKNRKQSTVIDNDKDIDLMTAEELRELVRDIYELSSVLRYDKPAKNEDHPTMKPIDLIKRQVKNSTKRGQKVLDIFGGSGTTLLACEELERSCYMMELDPKYCDVIIKRWEDMTGGKAVCETENVS